MKRLTLIAAGLWIWMGSVPSVWACTACYGKVDPITTNAVNMAIATLMAVLMGVLGSFAAFMVYLNKRSKMASMMDAASRTT